jgi:hypothetical protein
VRAPPQGELGVGAGAVAGEGPVGDEVLEVAGDLYRAQAGFEELLSKRLRGF